MATQHSEQVHLFLGPTGTDTLMRALHYLTVQDILWINLQVTKKVQHFNFAKLEEATFFQYAYGENKSLLQQAARFLSGFGRLHPFDAGNNSTAFIGALAFLKINGKSVNLSDSAASGWYEGARSKQKSGDELFSEILADDHDDHHGTVPNVRGAIEAILAQFPTTLASLAEDNVASATA